MHPKYLGERRLPRRLALRYLLMMSLLPYVITTGRHFHQLAEQPNGVVVPLRFDETVTAHWLGVCESLRLRQATGAGFF